MDFNNVHVFVVDSDSYPVHRDRLFCGIKNPNKISKIKKRNSTETTERPNTSYYGLIADLMAIREGDYVIFYQMRKEEDKFERGFRGIFKVNSEPFFSNEDVDGIELSVGKLGSNNKKVLGKCPHCNTNLSEKSDEDKNKKCVNCGKILENHILPNRILIKPIIIYEHPIDDNTAYIDRNYISNNPKENLPILWTMLFRKTSGEGRARSITHILPEEYKKLEKIFKNNCKVSADEHIIPYFPKEKSIIKIPLDTDNNGELKIEAFLEAWLMSKIKKEYIEGLSEIIGNGEDIEYFGNNVLYGIGGEKVDILLIHNDGTKRTQATVIELKKGKILSKDITQIKDYTKWMSQLIFGDDKPESKLKIQPILIGLKVSEQIKNQAKTLIGDTKKPILMEYIVTDNKIKFEKII